MAPPLPADAPQAGGLYTYRESEGGHKVCKVLAVDDRAVHVRLYTAAFPAAPTSVDLAAAAPLPFFIGHVPVSHRSFGSWGAQLVHMEAVSEEELEGYRHWAEAGGGVFG